MNLSLTLFHLLEALFVIAALVYVLMASLKLVVTRNMPGSRLIFGSIVFTLFGTVASAGYTYVVGEDNLLIEAAMDLALGIAFFTGALGFWRLSKFVVITSANPPYNQARANEVRAGSNTIG